MHYLLECDRLTNLEVTKNDILNKEIRYSFGNFSPVDAKHVIQTLTERSFYLVPDLIDELVRDLAGELGEVRPIELQVVGAQLQTENITTLAQYQELGPKEKLVEQFLEAIVKDCGAENERAAALVLYLLTDENNTRPLKTRAELAAALAAEADKLELVLDILLKSGIVFLIPQFPADRYQLVHDYLVSFIRQQRGAELLAELEREKQQRQMAEARINKLLRQQLRIAYGAGIGLLTLAVVAVAFGLKSTLDGMNFQLSALASSSEALLASNLQEEALIESIKAGEQLQRTIWANWIEADTRTQVLATLRQEVYESKGRELKTLKGHSDMVYSVSFSPDGKMIASASDDGTVILWNFNLANLLVLGCDWLKYYLPNHPETLEELQVCQLKPLLIAAASTLVEQGEKLAIDDNVEGAVAKFKQAKAWNPQLEINPETKAQAISLVKQAKDLVSQDEIKKAVSAYTKSQELDSSQEISADAWNSLCWQGSLQGYAKDVMFACEKAVAKAPEDSNIRDSRGLARALTGDTKGAIEDFQVYVNSTNDAKLKSQRQSWIKALYIGQNPFTKEELKRLREL